MKINTNYLRLKTAIFFHNWKKVNDYMLQYPEKDIIRLNWRCYLAACTGSLECNAHGCL